MPSPQHDALADKHNLVGPVFIRGLACLFFPSPRPIPCMCRAQRRSSARTSKTQSATHDLSLGNFWQKLRTLVLNPLGEGGALAFP